MSADIKMPDHIQELLSAAQNIGLSRYAKQWRESFAQTLSQKEIYVIFLGEFNHGKSSLINALIGEDVLPYGVTPTTQIDTYLHFCAKERLVTASAGTEKIAQWSWSDWKKASRNKLPDTLVKNSADRIDISLDTDVFDQDCVFIDTPGLNEASFVRESFLKRYIRRADLLLFLLDANQAMTHTEQDILSHLTQDQPANARAIVINKCDRLDDDECLEVCHYIENCLDLPIANEPFYMISSKKKSGDWDMLRDRINTEIEAGKQSYEVRNIEKLGSQLTATLEGFYPLYRALEQLDPQALRRIKKSW
ncbi:MAG: dynamin family protein, partial [Proteobacteria bacterium]|nr:dynamin family protein [Pseudomonadota bacterium]